MKKRRRSSWTGSSIVFRWRPTGSVMTPPRSKMAPRSGRSHDPWFTRPLCPIPPERPPRGALRALIAWGRGGAASGRRADLLQPLQRVRQGPHQLLAGRIRVEHGAAVGGRHVGDGMPGGRRCRGGEGLVSGTQPGAAEPRRGLWRGAAQPLLEARPGVVAKHGRAGELLDRRQGDVEEAVAGSDGDIADPLVVLSVLR